LRPLAEKFEELENLLLHHRGTLAQNTGVPFVRLVYRPDKEVECRRRRELLERTLRREGVAVETASCCGAIFAHYEQRSRLDQLFELERTEGDRLSSSIARHARRELTDQLLTAAERLKGDGVVFLVDAAFLYPYLHLHYRTLSARQGIWNSTGMGRCSFKKCSSRFKPSWKRLRSQRSVR